MEWVQTPVKSPPQPSWELRHGDVRLSVNPAQLHGQQWQYFSMSFGEFTHRPDPESLAQWPREAITIARKALDEFEAELEAEECTAPIQ